MNRSPVAVALMLMVAAVMVVVVVALVLRPWASANTDPMTKLNLKENVPEGYDRTQSAFPGIPGNLYPSWQPNGVPADPGYTNYVAHGCAFCHGLDGSGTAAAGPITSYDSDIVRLFVREGPGEMPAYSQDELTEEELQSIIDWISGVDTSQRAAPEIPHTLEGREDCLVCHSAGGFKPLPEDHSNRTVDTCLYCHT